MKMPFNSSDSKRIQFTLLSIYSFTHFDIIYTYTHIHTDDFMCFNIFLFEMNMQHFLCKLLK